MTTQRSIKMTLKRFCIFWMYGKHLKPNSMTMRGLLIMTMEKQKNSIWYAMDHLCQTIWHFLWHNKMTRWRWKKDIHTRRK